MTNSVLTFRALPVCVQGKGLIPAERAPKASSTFTEAFMAWET